MKILFIYPRYPETFWSFSYAMKFISKRAAFPPLGILTVSSLMPKTWEKRLVDLNVQKLNDRDILWADYVCISAMIVQKDSVVELIQRITSLNRKVIVGGPLFSVETMDDFPGVSHFILNEGEMTVPKFVADVESGAEIQRYYTSAIKPDLKKTPLPDWSLVNQNYYATMLLQFSRGCPFDCEFCDITKLNGRIPRTKSVEQTILELDSLYNFGWRGTVFFVDDNFIGNKQAVKAVLRAIGEWMILKDYPFTLLTEASINIAEDQELMDLMALANFTTVFIGLETPDEKALANCNKTQNLKINLTDAVHTLQDNGFEVQAGFIVGFDTDDETIFDRQIEFIQEVGVVLAMVGMLTALRGTKLYIRLEKEGRLLTESSGNNTDGTLNFVPKMDRQKLIDGHRRIVETIYSPKAYYQRILKFLAHYKPRHKTHPLTKNDVIAVILSIWKIGVLHRSRLYYWKAILFAAKKCPKEVPVVIALLIMGYHFDMMNKHHKK